MTRTAATVPGQTSKGPTPARQRLGGWPFSGDPRWLVRVVVLAVVAVFGLVGVIRPHSNAAAECSIEGSPATALEGASVDAGIKLTDSEMSYSFGLIPAFARPSLNDRTTGITVDGADNIGLVGLVVGGFPSVNAPYLVARASPSFGTVSLFRVEGATIENLGSLVEGSPAKGAIFGVKRTKSGLEMYRDCQYAGEFPLNLDPLLTSQPRFALELLPGARVEHIEYTP